MKVGEVFVGNIKATSLANNEDHNVEHHELWLLYCGLEVLILKCVDVLFLH